MTGPLFTDWESYFYPGTTVLINNFGLRDRGTLNDVEETFSLIRRDQLLLSPGNVDLTQPVSSVLRRIHGHIFQDVYPWAGQDRVVNLWKAGEFADTTVMATIADHAGHRSDWHLLTHDQMAGELARVYQVINHAHLFREGNGRTGKTYLALLAARAGMTMDWESVTSQTWNNASQSSRPVGGVWPPPVDLQNIFQAHILAPRGAVDPDIVQAMALHQQTFSAAPPQNRHTSIPTRQTPYQTRSRITGSMTGQNYGIDR